MNWLRPDLYRRWSASIVDRATITGVDPYLPSLKQNSSRRAACAVAEHLPFKADSFDLVTANMVVEHLENPEAVLRDVRRVLKPGGRFIFHTPNLDAPSTWLSRSLSNRLKTKIVPLLEGGRDEEDVFPTHYRLNDRDAILRVARGQGFELEDLQYCFTAPFTQMLGPLVLFELLLIRAFRSRLFSGRRPVLICVLRNPETA